MKQAKIKVKQIKTDWRGEQLPTHIGGEAGRAFEQKMKSDGFNLNLGKGNDGGKKFDLEVKTRATEAVSPVSVASMRECDILSTPYKDSVVCEKLQHQLRVTTENGIIITNEVYDLSQPHIQDKYEEAYEIARENIRIGNITSGGTAPGTRWGYFERKRDTKDSWVFRNSSGSMKKVEAMAKSTFGSIFDYGNKE
jgi:hypothetical protein